MIDHRVAFQTHLLVQFILVGRADSQFRWSDIRRPSPAAASDSGDCHFPEDTYDGQASARGNHLSSPHHHDLPDALPGVTERIPLPHAR